MFTDAVTMPATRKQNGAPPGQGGEEDGGDGEHVPVPEGIVDAMLTAAAALHDLNGRSRLVNSKAGSLYIVKPKMHGPEEGDFVVEMFGRVEDVLGMPRNTIKIGVRDGDTGRGGRLCGRVEEGLAAPHHYQRASYNNPSPTPSAAVSYNRDTHPLPLAPRKL
eukprot:scaffold10928_cov84-Isochrysis_galbana.AAC.1